MFLVRARRPGGRFPGLKPWAKILSPSGAINYPKSCLSSRHSAQGFGHASDLLKVCARSAATCLLFNCRAVSSACMYIDSSCQGQVQLRSPRDKAEAPEGNRRLKDWPRLVLRAARHPGLSRFLPPRSSVRGHAVPRFERQAGYR